MHRCADSGALTYITKLRIDRGLSFPNAIERLEAARAAALSARRALDATSGFWVRPGVIHVHVHVHTYHPGIIPVSSRCHPRRHVSSQYHPGIIHVDTAIYGRLTSCICSIPRGPYSGVCRRNNFAGATKPYVLLALEMLHGRGRGRINPNFIDFRIARPNIASVQPMKLVDLRTNYRHVTCEEAAPLWDYWRTYFATGCFHGKACSTKRVTGHCSVGVRYCAETIVTGRATSSYRSSNMSSPRHQPRSRPSFLESNGIL